MLAVGRWARLRGRPLGLGVAVAFFFALKFPFAFVVLALTFALFAALELATVAIVSVDRRASGWYERVSR